MPVRARAATGRAIHPEAMPVILTTDEERDIWMRRGTRPKRFSGRRRTTL
jgi:hypothetical protein